MEDLWSRGGLGWRELLVRTVRESWNDHVFGQAARLGFYHFLALFPSVLLLLLIAQPGSGPESWLSRALADSVDHLLPRSAALLIRNAVLDLHASAIQSQGVWIGVASAVWASVNGAWAMIDGLNVAYEVEERRSFARVCGIALAFVAIIAVATIAALLGGELAASVFSGLPALSAMARWLAITIALFVCLAVFFRIGLDLKNRRWQWSTPGAVIAASLWIAETLGFRFWMDHFNGYRRIYGRLAATVMLLIWLYVTAATVLLGAEMNSEIEKAAAEGGRDREISRKKEPQPR